MKIFFLTLLVVSLVFTAITGCSSQESPVSKPEIVTEPPETETSQEEYEIKRDASGTKYIVDPQKIVGGGPPKDGIPSIDNPKFVSVQEADQWLQDNELVLGIIHKGIERVYPLQILVWHEIVNEIIAGNPLLITY